MAELPRWAGKKSVCVRGGGKAPEALALASDRRLNRMISADRRGVTAMMHVAIKKTRMRLIAFGLAKDVFTGDASTSLLRVGRLSQASLCSMQRTGISILSLVYAVGWIRLAPSLIDLSALSVVPYARA